MYYGIKKAVRMVNADDELAALIITGTDDVFALGATSAGGPATTRDPIPSDMGQDVLPFLAIRDSRAPVIAAVNGICQAGGLLVAMLADICVASDRATFRVPELLRGIPDATYAAVLPPTSAWRWPVTSLLSARRFDAHEAQRLGVISRVVPTTSCGRRRCRPPTRCSRPRPTPGCTSSMLNERWLDRLPDHVLGPRARRRAP